MLNSTLSPSPSPSPSPSRSPSLGLRPCIKTMANTFRCGSPHSVTLLIRHGRDYLLLLAVPHDVLPRDNHFVCLKDTFRLLCPHYSLSIAPSKCYAHVKTNLPYATCSHKTNMANNYKGNQGFFFSGVGHTVRDPSVQDAFIVIDNNGEV